MSEIAQAKKEQTGRSVRAFNMFLVAFLVFLGCSYIIQHNPDWVSTTLTYVEQTGIFEKIRLMMVG